MPDQERRDVDTFLGVALLLIPVFIGMGVAQITDEDGYFWLVAGVLYALILLKAYRGQQQIEREQRQAREATERRFREGR